MSISGNAGWNPTDVAAIASGADTAAVLAGQVITFPSGATITVPVGSTLVGTILTTSDGNSIDLATLDTNTFATLAGQVITFADGSTLTVPTGSTIVGDVITTSDGSSYDLSDLVSNATVDNGDGTATITNPDGSMVDVCTDCTQLESKTIVNADGTLSLVDADDNVLSTWGEIPSVECDSSSNGQKNLLVGGVAVGSWTDNLHINSVGSASSANITDATPVNDVISGPISIPLIGSDCGTRGIARCIHTYKVISGNGGSVTLRPQVSADGGATWVNMPTGGSDQVDAIATTLNTEVEFNDALQVGTVTTNTTYQVRVVITFNNLSAGSVISVPTATAQMESIRSRCC